jgi:hypothetical protein
MARPEAFYERSRIIRVRVEGSPHPPAFFLERWILPNILLMRAQASGDAVGLKVCDRCGGNFSNYLKCCLVCGWSEDSAEIPPPLPKPPARSRKSPPVTRDEPPPLPASLQASECTDAKLEDDPGNFLDIPAIVGESLRDLAKLGEDICSRPDFAPVLARIFGLASSMILAELGYGSTPAGANRACSFLERIDNILGTLDPRRQKALRVRIQQQARSIQVAGTPALTSNVRARLCAIASPTKDGSLGALPSG